MKKLIGFAAVLFAVSCASPENRAESTSDSMNKTNENGVTNSPPGGITDTSGGVQMDGMGADTTKGNMNMQGDTTQR